MKTNTFKGLLRAVAYLYTNQDEQPLVAFPVGLVSNVCDS